MTLWGEPLLNQASIFVAEDQAFIALDLTFAIEDAGGVVVGPVASVKEGLILLETVSVSGAILDINLVDGDCLPILERLKSLGVPVVLQTGMGLPPGWAARFPDLSVNIKPCMPADLVATLDVLVAAAAEAA